MDHNQIKELINYWEKTAKHDYEIMISLFKIKKYPECLFFGHLALEKILKALIVKKTLKHPKPIHNLLILLNDSDIILKKQEKEFLTEVNKFLIRTRYPDYKLAFYKLCTKKYTEIHLKKIENIFHKLCKNLIQ